MTVAAVEGTDYDEPTTVGVIDTLSAMNAVPLAVMVEIHGWAAIEQAEDASVITVSDGAAPLVTLSDPADRGSSPSPAVARTLLDATVRTAHRCGAFDDAMAAADLALTLDDPSDYDCLLISGAEAALARLDTSRAARYAAAVSAGALYAKAMNILGYAQSTVGQGVDADRAFTAAASSECVETRAVARLLRFKNALWVTGDTGRARACVADISGGDAALALVSATSGDSRAAIRFRVSALGQPIRNDSLASRSIAALLGGLAVVIGAADAGAIGVLGEALDVAYEYMSRTLLATHQLMALGLFGAAAHHITGDTVGQQSLASRVADAVPGGPYPGWRDEVSGITALTRGDMHTSVGLLSGVIDRLDAADAPAYLGYRARIDCADAAAQTGDVDTADRLLHTHRTDPHPGFAYLSGSASVAQAWITAADDVGEAASILDVAARDARTRGRHGVEAYLLETRLRLGDASAAPRLRELAETLPDLPRARLGARFGTALEAADTDLLCEAAAAYRAAGLEAPAVDATAHAALAATDPLSGVTVLAQADVRAERLGLCTPAVVAARAADGLSIRQRHITARAAAGAPNREIADELGVSVRTVEGHLYRVGRTIDIHHIRRT
ncbi:hypothetical protein nbrc107696_13630 [Gordonia spumicola]|uniref:HTH luxR-type domain-containing protein n=1 Tax=Gordonia spumicola TaxID=589161 RepID=A0A7I9V6K5_9ACTN|nr:helix-turn-helix transcriptional regulator [Gordonia spumicola]GEE00917.1 hypothetical protein nbrc107696_13630 [Gordonia spumicola]